MGKYHGRARQRININRKQAGQKMQGGLVTVGNVINARGIKQRRVRPSGVRCVKNGKFGLRTFDKKGCEICQTNSSILLVKAAPFSRQCAGGVHRVFPFRCR